MSEMTMQEWRDQCELARAGEMKKLVEKPIWVLAAENNAKPKRVTVRQVESMPVMVGC